MSRRIELELTSERPDGTWTWRAAGAREPRGELDGALLPGGAKVGDVLRAEADFHIEGIEILSIVPTKDARNEPQRIELIGPQREFTPVTSTLASRSDRRPRRDQDRPDRGDRPSRPRDDRPRSPRPTTPRADRPRRERPAPPPPKPKPKKLRPSRTHRDALLASLGPEQQPVAEQLLRGGMPSVRTALEEQNAKAAADGLPSIPVATILAIAEELLPRTRVADWLDRAEAALADAEEIALRDLRAVVTSADDVARDESTRELATRLREVLDRRATAEQQEWLQDVTSSLEGGRVVRALRLSSRPPQPSETLPAELATRLADAASAAMTAEIASDRWATLLDAVAYSPVRRSIVPAGAPAEPGDDLMAMARKHAGRVPSAAKLFGIEPPPPTGKRAPKPRPKPSPQKVSHPPLPPGPAGERRIPPPPVPRRPAPAAEATADETTTPDVAPEPPAETTAADVVPVAQPPAEPPMPAVAPEPVAEAPAPEVETAPEPVAEAAPEPVAETAPEPSGEEGATSAEG